MDGISMVTMISSFVAIVFGLHRFGISPQFENLKEMIGKQREKLEKVEERTGKNSEDIAEIKTDLHWLKNNSGSEDED